MKINKKTKNTLKIIICIIIIFLVLKYFLSYYVAFFGADQMTKDEISTVLTENIIDFEDTAKLLNKYANEYSYIKIERADREYSIVETLFHHNEILVKNRDGEIMESLQKEIENSNIKHIMNNLDFELIVVDSEQIRFINRTSVGSAPQLVYTIDGESPDDLYLWDAEKIIDHWYYWCD